MFEKLLDKKYLVKYDLSTELFKEFGLKVYDVTPVRSVYIIYTDKGTKVLKRIDYSLEEFLFIESSLKYIEKSFDRVINFQKALNGESYTIWGKDIYCIMDLVEGRECDYYNPIEVSIASKGLATLHKASMGLKNSYKSRSLLNHIIKRLERKKDELELFKKLAFMFDEKSEFDSIFIDNVDYYLKEIEESITVIKNSEYKRLCKEKDKISLCHHDLAHHNILIKDEAAFFIDFDYSVIDLRVHDLANFILKVVKNMTFDINKADNIIKDYNNILTLDERELKVLYGFLSFPEDFYSISKDYYTKRKTWDENVFLQKLKRKVDFKEDREEFLKAFKDKFII